jgi:hypothetical protein
MAKKQTKKVEVEEPYVEETVVLEVPKPEPKRSCEKNYLRKAIGRLKTGMYYLNVFSFSALLFNKSHLVYTGLTKRRDTKES